MGIRIHRETWSSPLKLIDSWLPLSSQPVRVETAKPSQSASRFIKAGWLQRAASNDAPPNKTSPRTTAVAPRHEPHSCSSRADRSRPADGRIGLSGRMSDVCAELDRLVAMDLQQSHRQG